MVTYTLQWVVALLLLVFAVLALRSGRPQVSPDPFYQCAWWLAGATFLTESACQALQYAWGGMALWGGTASAQMQSYLRWSPAFNHSRTFLSLAFFGALLGLALARRPPGKWFWRAYMCLVGLALALGVLAGATEGSLLAIRHYVNIALWDTVELLVALSTLLVLLFTNRVDRYLWGALAINAFSVALSIIWLVALSRIDDPHTWTPAPWQIAAYRAVLELFMVLLAARRLALARRGTVVGGLIESGTPRVPTFSA